MDDQKFDLAAVEILDQAAIILRDAQDEIAIEDRIDDSLEVIENIRYEQESINLIDRIRNTEDQITIRVNCSSFPIVIGSVRFTSDEFIVIRTKPADFLVNISQVLMVSQVEELAVFRTNQGEINTTTMWIKNLIDCETQVTIYLVGGNQLVGKLTRFSHDHLDLRTNTLNILLPLSAVVLIRSSNEKFTD